MRTYANQVLDDPITLFIKNHCTGTIYDSCVNSPCRYSSSSGCTHPLHPKNFDAYDENIIQTVREGTCEACEATRKGVPCHYENECDAFLDECVRLLEEQEEEDSAREAMEMEETERRFARDIMSDIGRGLR
jgi:hypothetical protein